MTQLFVTGMLRSGTSLVQVLLTNHPQIFVAYQPYYQFYVDIRQRFLEEHGIKKFLPLGDGLDSGEEELSLFNQWIRVRHFDADETADLVANATTFKGGGAKSVGATIMQGTFFDIRNQLHISLANNFKPGTLLFIGAKEVLCEEYVPALIKASVRCLIIVRDPRAVIASACYGSYQKAVGDRYPLLMLIRLWRKSAAYWLAFRNDPLVHAIRYEDIIQNSNDTLHKIARWLDIPSFLDGLIGQPLCDHAGEIWKGNSSFGDKIGIDASTQDAWRALLTSEEIRFIEACTKPELAMLGYSYSKDLHRSDLSDFVEDTSGVRDAYLSRYCLNQVNKELELQRWDAAEQSNYGGLAEKKLFLFPSVFDM